MGITSVILLSIIAVTLALAIQDVFQKKHAIRRNFPVLGRFRYWLEMVGPELRQYIVTKNDEEKPFSRDQRRWVYASSKRENNLFGFGTDNDLENDSNHLIIKHAAFPYAAVKRADDLFSIPCGKVLGQWGNRPKKFRPASVVNVSGMSFGSLSPEAVKALNLGCMIARCLQSTGEGGISKYHQMGGDLIWQIGTGYFGCRDANGRFSLEALKETLRQNPNVRALEIKLSQGAKPGKGGVLPGIKVSQEIAEIRGIPVGEDCISPAAHSAFHNVETMVAFIEMLAAETGLPVGIKSAVGEDSFWEELSTFMARTQKGPDFITIDGGEGGTGAAPLHFTDHVSLPFKIGFSRVYGAFARAGIADKVFFIGSGKLGFPQEALFAFSLGCDSIAVAREALLAIGCIQAQRCHTDHCPTGVTTQNRWLRRGLDPTLKSVRCANYLITLRKEILDLCHACGVSHPSLITPEHFEILNDRFGSDSPRTLFGYEDGWRRPGKEEYIQLGLIMENGKPK